MVQLAHDLDLPLKQGQRLGVGEKFMLLYFYKVTGYEEGSASRWVRERVRRMAATYP